VVSQKNTFVSICSALCQYIASSLPDPTAAFARSWGGQLSQLGDDGLSVA
jgi:hypothetical protein